VVAVPGTWLTDGKFEIVVELRGGEGKRGRGNREEKTIAPPVKEFLAKPLN
jgi:hypothetical protein